MKKILLAIVYIILLFAIPIVTIPVTIIYLIFFNRKKLKKPVKFFLILMAIIFAINMIVQLLS